MAGGASIEIQSQIALSYAREEKWVELKDSLKFLTIDINYAEENKTILSYVTAANQWELAKHILTTYEDVNINPHMIFSDSAISNLAKSSDVSIQTHLIIQQRSHLFKNIRTPLWYAIESGKEDIVTYFLERDATLESVLGMRDYEFTRFSPEIRNILLDMVHLFAHCDLHIAAKEGDWNTVQALLNIPYVNANFEIDEKTPLWHAIQERHHGAIKMLLKKGAVCKTIDGLDFESQEEAYDIGLQFRLFKCPKINLSNEDEPMITVSPPAI